MIIITIRYIMKNIRRKVGDTIILTSLSFFLHASALIRVWRRATISFFYDKCSSYFFRIGTFLKMKNDFNIFIRKKIDAIIIFTTYILQQFSSASINNVLEVNRKLHRCATCNNVYHVQTSTQKT